jgi:perosamine synthetase
MALELSLVALEAKGSVILPALTFVSTGLAALHNGNKVVFADVDEDTLCIDWADVAAKRTRRTQTIVPVWYGGTVEPVPDWAANVVEDCAHATGSLGAGKQGRVACWSFQAVKNLAAGDGGMITTDDIDLASKLRALRWCGIDRSTWDRDKGQVYGWDYNVIAPGYKAHMNDITAALALAQLARLDELNLARKIRVCRYLDNVGGLAGIDWLTLPKWNKDSSWHLFVVRVQERDRFIDHMLANGVSAGVHYKPLNTYDIFGPRQDLPVTDKVWRTLVTLPLYPGLSEEDQDKVIATVKSFTP